MGSKKCLGFHFDHIDVPHDHMTYHNLKISSCKLKYEEKYIYSAHLHVCDKKIKF